MHALHMPEIVDNILALPLKIAQTHPQHHGIKFSIVVPPLPVPDLPQHGTQTILIAYPHALLPAQPSIQIPMPLGPQLHIIGVGEHSGGLACRRQASGQQALVEMAQEGGLVGELGHPDQGRVRPPLQGQVG